MKKGTRNSIIVLIVALALVLVVLAGPRVSTMAEITETDRPPNLTKYLSDKESLFSDLVPGTEKTIAWYGSPNERTEIGLVFLHGFTGSRQELVPAIDIVAEKLQANLYYNRFAGHGRGAEAMAEPVLQDWVDDASEALAIGRRIGDKVVVVAMSTAAPIAAWLCSRGVSPEALVMVSPNFGPADSHAELILLPWGNLIVKLVIGDYNEFEVINEKHARYSTSRYRSEALLPMMAAVEMGRESELGAVKVPLLCLFSAEDDVVSLEHMREAFDRIGSPVKSMQEIESADHHVLAGDIHSPQATEECATAIIDFVQYTVPRSR